MRLADINKLITSTGKAHFEDKANDEASRKALYIQYYQDEYGFTTDEADFHVAAGHEPELINFHKWYYFNHVNTSVIS